jgi:hypothetical protein
LSLTTAFSGARRPASVIRTVTTSIGREPATTRLAVALASPARTSSTMSAIVKPCASYTCKDPEGNVWTFGT